MTQRSYQASATITSNCQTSPMGQALFEADQNSFSPYVSITHQISTDGVNFTTIQPGEVTLPAKWWYRALLNRSSQAFTSNSQPLIPTTADPNYSAGFTLASSTSTAVSPTTIERTLVFENVTAAIPLRETPIPGTLAISQGTVYLTSSQYSLDSDNTRSLPRAAQNIPPRAGEGPAPTPCRLGALRQPAGQRFIASSVDPGSADSLEMLRSKNQRE